MSHSGTALIDPYKIFERISLSAGERVADLGCGRTGHFVFPAVKVVGEKGIVYAVDVVKNILESIKSMARSGGFDNIQTVYVPGSFELPSAAQIMLGSSRLDAVICLGSIIRGETPHFDFIAQAVANAIQQVALMAKKPVIFGVLTDNTLEQAQARSGGAMGNKGIESAVAALKMIGLQRDLENSWNL